MVSAPRTRPRWAAWAPIRTADATVLVALGVVAGTTAAVWAGALWRPVAGPGFTPMLFASLALAGLVGVRQLGVTRARLGNWGPSYAVWAVVLALTVHPFLAHVGGWRAVGAFFVGALEEELVFRLAAVLAFGGVTAWWLRRPPGDLSRWGTAPRVVAVAGSSLLFLAMPGHLAQVRSPLAVVPFVAVAVSFGYVVLRTGDLLPGVVAHAVLNLATVTHTEGGMSRVVWAAVVIVTLWAYARGAVRAATRRGFLEPAREPEAAAATAARTPAVRTLPTARSPR